MSQHLSDTTNPPTQDTVAHQFLEFYSSISTLSTQQNWVCVPQIPHIPAESISVYRFKVVRQEPKLVLKPLAEENVDAGVNVDAEADADAAIDADISHWLDSSWNEPDCRVANPGGSSEMPIDKAATQRCVDPKMLTHSPSSLMTDFPISNLDYSPLLSQQAGLPDSFSPADHYVAHRFIPDDTIQGHHIERRKSADTDSTLLSFSQEVSPKGRARSTTFPQARMNTSLSKQSQPRKQGHRKTKMNSFLLFSREQRRRILDTDMFLSTNELAIQMGQLWKTISKEEKEDYRIRAKAMNKVEYLLDDE